LSMGNTLRQAGHDIVGFARDHLVALRLADTAHPDLALVELTLASVIGGTVVAQRLREQFDIPTVFVTANPEHCRTVGPRVGALACLVKPFTSDELVQAVEVAGSVMRLKNPDRVPPNMELYFVV
jgi:DNA-binding response OmpR family regulator